MRVTLQTIHKNTLTNLNKINDDLNRISNQISSQSRMSRVSDDPVSLVAALGMRSSLAELKQYQDNLVYGRNIIDSSENSLTQMKELVIRAKLLTLQSINASNSVETRANTAPEIKNLFSQSVILANTQINDKYIFAGYRTTGYDQVEKAPFMEGLVSGYQINTNTVSSVPTMLTGVVGNGQDLSGGDLLINGIDVGAVTLAAGLTEGLNMSGAASLRAAVDGRAFGAAVMSARLTTLDSHDAATGAATSDGVISFSLNGVAIGVNVTSGDSAATVNSALTGAINAASGITGVTALMGDGTNGAAADKLILKNARSGNDAAITIAGFANTAAGTGVSIADGSQAADAAHNTGEVSFSASESFRITTSAADDAVLNLVGLGGGSRGFVDEANDGELLYGPRLGDGDLRINGIAIGAASADGRSTIFTDASAEAKANAINALSDQTGVSADIVPVFHAALGGVEAGTLGPGDLIINGIDIFSAPTTIQMLDTDNVLVEAINAKSAQTGVAATRDQTGRIMVTTVATPTATSSGIGRNLHIRTSGNGEGVTHLNSGGSAPGDRVYFGSLRLRSDNAILLETTPTAVNQYEPGFAAIGLDGGQARSGEEGDLAGDGVINVLRIASQEGNVRYTGDKYNDLAIKVGKASTIAVSKNGQDTLMTTGVFETLKNLEYYLQGTNFTRAKGTYVATDPTLTLEELNSREFDEDKHFSGGYFTITIKDKAYSPPRDFIMNIPVDVQNDTLTSVAGKINGVPWLSASWNSEGLLEIAVADPDRYTIAVSDWSSNFLRLAGVTTENMQIQALDDTLAKLDNVMNNITRQVADFGARSNRMDVQDRIFSNLELATSENLSEKQDTDIMKAVMELRAKETAYQAALAAASRTMQLSLVNYI